MQWRRATRLAINHLEWNDHRIKSNGYVKPKLTNNRQGPAVYHYANIKQPKYIETK